jgi:glycosyltransferase involved in cell wall biosynthesis
MKKKILIIITKGEVGGAQMSVLNLAKEIKRRNLDVSVAAGKGDFLPSQLQKYNIPFFSLNKLKRNYNPISIFSYINELKGLINKYQFTTLHFNSSNTLPGVLAAKFSKLKPKTVFTIRGWSVLDKYYPASKLKKYLFLLYFKFFFLFLDHPVFISHDNLDYAKKLGLNKNNHLIYNGLKLSEKYFLSASVAKKELSGLVDRDVSGNYIIASIGRLADQKNYQFLINNFTDIQKIIPKAKLIIIGEGPEREKYESLIKKQNLENYVFLPGERKQASELLKGIDLFILPSLYEGLSISLIETVKAEIPTLASDVGGNREVIGKDNCFELNNKEVFLDKLKRGYIKLNNQNKFPIEVTVDKYIELYESN